MRYPHNAMYYDKKRKRVQIDFNSVDPTINLSSKKIYVEPYVFYTGLKKIETTLDKSSEFLEGEPVETGMMLINKFGLILPP